MGYFSFLTNDTKKSIIVGHSKIIFMIDNKGNRYIEKQYEGYGIFGNKDIHMLFAEMNHITVDREVDETDENYNDRIRSLAINIWHNDINNEYIYPNLVQYNYTKWKNEKPKDCPDQGIY